MLHYDGALGPDPRRVIELAAAAFGFFFAWVAAFERGLEPLLRRLCGRVVGCAVVWLAVGPFRIWGPREPSDRAREAAIAVSCSVVVLASAAVPVVALHLVSLALEAEGEDVGAAAYLMSLPLIV
ncbi:MAG: hypothetical protein ACRENE_32095, partial [Polyangiaceae bacterium]